MPNWVKQHIGLNAKLAVISDLISSYDENFFLAQESFFMGIDILRDVKMWEWKDLWINVRSISHFCECDLLWKFRFV